MVYIDMNMVRAGVVKHPSPPAAGKLCAKNDLIGTGLLVNKGSVESAGPGVFFGGEGVLMPAGADQYRKGGWSDDDCCHE